MSTATQLRCILFLIYPGSFSSPAPWQCSPWVSSACAVGELSALGAAGRWAAQVAPRRRTPRAANKALRFFAGIRLQQLTLNTSGVFFSSLFHWFVCVFQHTYWLWSVNILRFCPPQCMLGIVWDCFVGLNKTSNQQSDVCQLCMSGNCLKEYVTPNSIE